MLGLVRGLARIGVGLWFGFGFGFGLAQGLGLGLGLGSKTYQAVHVRGEHGPVFIHANSVQTRLCKTLSVRDRDRDRVSVRVSSGRW